MPVTPDPLYAPRMGIRRVLIGIVSIWGLGTTVALVQGPSFADAYREPVARLVRAATADRFAWDRLAVLTDTYGHRLSGSQALEDAFDWAAETMRRDGFDRVWMDPVKVPKWVRGTESLELTAPRRHSIPMLGLGMSVGTPPDGIEAELMIVNSFAEFERRSAEARGRIVLFNAPFRGYGQTVTYRTTSASLAAQHGARAVLVRSVGPEGLRTPHTGMLTYRRGVPQIPAAAIPTEDANRLARLAAAGTRLRVRLSMAARTEPDADSANLIAELRGRERPDELIVVACHFDSWDVGTGASDDGGACIAVWEAARLMLEENLRPRRTVRVVLFTNEENGLRGGLDYRTRYANILDRHVLMFESDLGVAAPTGFGFSGNDLAREQVTAIASLLESIGATHIGPAGGGADIGPSVAAGRIPSMSPEVDSSKYFIVHHTEADTVERIDPAGMARHVAAVAGMIYVIADMPARLGEPTGTR
jgi:carboxypeptidase Q